jgi:hypothetical protein
VHGVEVKPQTLAVWRCTKRRKIRYRKLGNSVRYHTDWLDEFAQSLDVDPSGGAP